MKMNNVVLSTFTGDDDLIKFPFRDVRMKEPFIVEAISGLDALDIISNFSGFSGSSTAFYDMSLGARTIVMRLALHPTFRNAKTYSSLRDQLYRLISPDRTGKIVVYFCQGDDKIARVEGKVAKLEANHFEKTNKAQITITCDEGVLRSPTINQIDISSFGREFFLTDCISTAPHGAYMEFTFLEPTSEFIFTGADTTFSVRRMEEGGVVGFPEGSVIKVSSERSDRYVKVQHSGIEKSIIESVEGFRGSQWPMIYPGRNRFNIISKAEITKLEYREAWWGV